MLADPPPLTSALRQIVTNKQMVDRKHMRRAEIRQWTCLIQNGLEICLWVTLVYMGHPWPRWATLGHFGHSSELYMNCIWAIHHRYCRCECCATWWDVEHNGGRPNWIWVKGSSASRFLLIENSQALPHHPVQCCITHTHSTYDIAVSDWLYQIQISLILERIRPKTLAKSKAIFLSVLNKQYVWWKCAF